MAKLSNDYRSVHMVEFEQFPTYSFSSMDVLTFLIGRKWDDFALGWIHSVQPTSIRVTTGECTCDTRSGRVTVIVDADDVITSISQEVMVGLPDGFESGHHMRTYLTDERPYHHQETSHYCPYVPKDIVDLKS